ncbi:DUF1737 domain-containing protein [Armatimonas sp.]
MYKVVEAKTKAELEKLVTEFMEQGWQLQGGIAVMVDEHRWYYVQALVK